MSYWCQDPAMESLFSITKTFIKKSLASELLYEPVSADRLQQIQSVHDLLDQLSEAKRHQSARKIQRWFRTRNHLQFRCIAPFSICSTGVTEYLKNNRVRFTLFCDGLNYACFVTPSMIRKVELVNSTLARVHMDRFRVRHCADRYLDIDLVSKRVIWNECCPSTQKITASNILHSSQIRVRV